MATLFQTPTFLLQSNIYEVNVRQYTQEGTFNAFANHLPRLKDMGVEILWLMPIHPIGIEKRKGTLGSYYSIKDHKGINPEFGTEADLHDLITKAHALNMRIILDWVANHTAWDHVWTKTHPEFFIKDEQGNFKPPYDWDDVLQIDHANKEEQIAMTDAMKYWIREFNIDGFRADLAHLTPLQFWKNARLQLSGLKKDLVWLAETEDISYHEAFDICYTWEWMHATEKLVRKEIRLATCIDLLKRQREEFREYPLRMFFTSNHDENSWNGTEYEKYGVYAKALAVFSCLYPGIPLIYSGQELPNTKRLKFFEKDQVEWGTTNGLQDLYRALLSLRKANTAIREKGFVQFFDNVAENNILAWKMEYDDDAVIVFINMSEVHVKENIAVNLSDFNYRDVFSYEVMALKDEYSFSAAPGEFTVLEKIQPE